MSESATPARPFYVTGGTLKPGEPSYVERRADTDLFESILAGEFCYVLTARQMGKSSLMARTATRLEQAGVASAIVDLTQIGSERGAQGAAQWYFGIANEIHRRLKITEPLRSWWQERSDLPPAQRLTGFFRELVLAHCSGRVVIFVDEIDSTIGLPFADDFFAALRACFNARATEPEFERLTFVLLGVATPDQLIQDPTRTPFNIGKRIDLTDFSPDEARTLAPGLHAEPGEAERRLERILDWTGGHPYLTQALCRAVREKGADSGKTDEAVDPQINELFLTSRAQREETNLKHVRARLERPGSEGRRLLQLYLRVRQGKPVRDQPTSPLFAQLKLAGVGKATDEGRLAVRNRIYESVFTPEWAKSAMPADRGRQLAAATLATTLAGVFVWYAAFQPRPNERAFLAAIQDEANNGDAYNSANSAYTALRANPFSRSRATDLMQLFWEQRALRYAQFGKRDESLLSYLQGLSLKESERLRREAGNLIGSDYERLQATYRHSDEVSAVSFSRDGRFLVTGSKDRTARLWDVVTSKPLGLPFRHREGVNAVALDPEGRIFVTGTEDGTYLWDVVTGKMLRYILKTHRVQAVAFSPDGRAIATGTEEDLWSGGAQLWDVRTGKPLAPLLKNEMAVHALAFSPDGRTVAILTGPFEFGSVRLLDARTGKLVFNLQDQEFARAVAFSPDSLTVAIGSSKGSLQFFDTRTGKLLSTWQNHSSVEALAFSADGRVLAIGASDGNAQLFDARTGTLIALPLQHGDSVYSVAFSPDGRTLAIGYRDKTARLWEARTGKALAPSLQQKAFAAIVAFSSDGRALAMGYNDKTVWLLDTRAGGRVLSPRFHPEANIRAVAFSPDGRTLAMGYGDKTVRLWDAATGKQLAPPFQNQSVVYTMAFSPDGRTLATGSTDNIGRLWDTQTGKLLLFFRQHEAGIDTLAFSPDGRCLATGSIDSTARLWDTHTGQTLTPPLQHENGVVAVAFSRDGRALATAEFESSTVHLWGAATGKPLTTPLTIQERARTLVFSPNGRSFVVATVHWLNTYSWDGRKAALQSSQLLHGFWEEGFRFPIGCEQCLQVVLGGMDKSLHLETVRLDEPIDPPIKGDPKELLEKWKSLLGLTFDEQMRPVPAVDLPGGPEGAVGDGRRSPGARPR